MAVQIFDDGTQVVTDASGAVVSYTDTAGNVTVPDTSIVRDWLGVLSGVGLSAIQRAFNPAPTPKPPATPSAPGAQRSTLTTIALVIGGALLLKKLLR